MKRILISLVMLLSVFGCRDIKVQPDPTVPLQKHLYDASSFNHKAAKAIEDVERSLAQRLPDPVSAKRFAKEAAKASESTQVNIDAASTDTLNVSKVINQQSTEITKRDEKITKYENDFWSPKQHAMALKIKIVLGLAVVFLLLFPMPFDWLSIGRNIISFFRWIGSKLIRKA